MSLTSKETDINSPESYSQTNVNIKKGVLKVRPLAVVPIQLIIERLKTWYEDSDPIEDNDFLEIANVNTHYLLLIRPDQLKLAKVTEGLSLTYYADFVYDMDARRVIKSKHCRPRLLERPQTEIEQLLYG